MNGKVRKNTVFPYYNIALYSILFVIIIGLGGILMFHVKPNIAYPWIKSIHVIGVISWMAGMLYLPRLFVYHSLAERGSVQSETFKLMEQRLLRFIMNPSMVISWITGLWLGWKIFGFSEVWIHVKLTAVIFLSAVHGYFAKEMRLFVKDQNIKSGKYWKIINEIPTILMIIVVIMVVVKPF